MFNKIPYTKQELFDKWMDAESEYSKFKCAFHALENYYNEAKEETEKFKNDNIRLQEEIEAYKTLSRDEFNEIEELQKTLDRYKTAYYAIVDEYCTLEDNIKLMVELTNADLLDIIETCTLELQDRENEIEVIIYDL